MFLCKDPSQQHCFLVWSHGINSSSLSAWIVSLQIYLPYYITSKSWNATVVFFKDPAILLVLKVKQKKKWNASMLPFITLPLKTSPFAFRIKVKIFLVRTFSAWESNAVHQTPAKHLLTFSIVISLMCMTNALAWTFKPLPSFSSSEHRVRQPHQYFNLIRNQAATKNIKQSATD